MQTILLGIACIACLIAGVSLGFLWGSKEAAKEIKTLPMRDPATGRFASRKDVMTEALRREMGLSC